MEYTIFQVALVFIVTFVAAIDQFNFCLLYTSDAADE